MMEEEDGIVFDNDDFAEEKVGASDNKNTTKTMMTLLENSNAHLGEIMNLKLYLKVANKH